MTRLPGDQQVTYQLQYRKCGKPSCRTCRSGRGHGPYWYAYRREGSRVHVTYIGKVDPLSAAASISRSIPDNTKETVSGAAVEEPNTAGGKRGG